MNSGGVLLVVVGVWVLCQVLGGDALVRLGVTEAAAASATDTQKIPGTPTVPGGQAPKTEGGLKVIPN